MIIDVTVADSGNGVSRQLHGLEVVHGAYEQTLKCAF